MQQEGTPLQVLGLPAVSFSRRLGQHLTPAAGSFCSTQQPAAVAPLHVQLSQALQAPWVSYYTY
jgi:hypothetical protein